MANSVDPDEAVHDEPCHLDLCCLQILLFIFLLLNPIAFRKAKIVDNIGLSECNKVKGYILVIFYTSQSSRFSNVIRNNILEKKTGNVMVFCMFFRTRVQVIPLVQMYRKYFL